MSHEPASNVLALDIGGVRVGVAIASLSAKLPRPLTTLTNDPTLVKNLQRLIKDNSVTGLVIGLPRDMNGEETRQAELTRRLGARLADQLDLKVYWIDETLSSERARAILEKRRGPYSKGDIDALAASLILEDYLNNEVA